MRFLISSAILAVTATALEASVWTFDTTTKGPSISPENARLVLAHRLGLSRYHKLANADDNTLELLNKAQQPLFSADAASRKFLLFVEGADDGLVDLPPAFTILNPPNSVSNEKLVEDLLQQDKNNRDGAQCSNQLTNDYVRGGFSANEPAGFCTINTDAKFDHSESVEQTLAFLEGDAYAMEQVYGRPLPPSITSDYTAIIQFKLLEDYAQRFGVESKQYTSLKEQIRLAIARARDSNALDQLIVVAMPSQTGFVKRDSYGQYEMPLALRKEAILTDATASSTAVHHAQATTPSNRTLPKTTISVCWSSENACKANTAECSGHGSCIKKYSEKISDEETGAECWACACTPTVIKNAEGQQTIYWGGPACQKKDISTPFFLFAGFTIAAFAALAYGVGMLYSIGEEDLPSVLGAGVAPPSRK